jgi:hypothetical protein
VICYVPNLILSKEKTVEQFLFALLLLSLKLDTLSASSSSSSSSSHSYSSFFFSLLFVKVGNEAEGKEIAKGGYVV